jgi:NADPH2:quinone reductase
MRIWRRQLGAKLKAVLCRALGSPLVVEEIAPPACGSGEALVRVTAVGLNFFDTLIVAGKYQVKPQLPFSPGGELAGVTADGRRVMGYCGHGAAREQICIDPRKLVPIPDGVSDMRAASLPIAYGTTLHALRDRARLKSGETLAVLGASGGVGQAAVEIGKLMGARVIACASSEEKVAFCRSLGADEVINYGTADLKEALKATTKGEGVSVVYDPVGGALTEPALRALAWGGRYLVVGFAAGEIPRPPLNLVLLKGADVLGVYWGSHVEREPVRHRANMEQLLAWTAEGKLRPHVHRTYRFDEADAALAEIAARRVIGKIVLVP